MHGVHQLGEVVESLGAAHQTLLFDMDGLGQLPDVQLSHLFERSLTFESLERHWENGEGVDAKYAVYSKKQDNLSSILLYLRKLQENASLGLLAI